MGITLAILFMLLVLLMFIYVFFKENENIVFSIVLLLLTGFVISIIKIASWCSYHINILW